MRVSVNVPSIIAAVLFGIAWFGSTEYGKFNYVPWELAGLFFLALTGLIFFNRGTQ